MNDKVKNTLKKVLDAKKLKEEKVRKEQLKNQPRPSSYKIITQSFL
jgi:hypothetical protein